MKNNDMQSLMLLLSPPDDALQLAAYLRATNRALRGKSDADLAKAMGVASSSVANWKRRGVVADSGKAWFRERLLAAIASRSDEHLPRAELAAVAPVVAAIAATHGNPLGASRDAPFANAMAFAAMLAWAQFVVDVSRILAPPGPSFNDEQVSQYVAAGIRTFLDAPGLSVFR